MARQKKKPTRQTNQLRIIGGQWRGRKLNFPDGEGLRPTTDRVRETVFNWLRGKIAGAHCLDLFAGSGALGLEALSQGAAHVTFVDQNPNAISSLKNNLSVLAANNVTVVHQDAFQFLTSHQNQFDVIFLDPPFGKDLMQKIINLIQASHCLREGGVIYLESETDLIDLELPERWSLEKDKKAGAVNFGLIDTAW